MKTWRRGRWSKPLAARAPLIDAQILGEFDDDGSNLFNIQRAPTSRTHFQINCECQSRNKRK